MKKVWQLVVLGALILLVRPAAAAPLIIGLPPDSRGNCIPFGCYDSFPGEYQQVYSSSAFSGPITITGLEFYNTQSNSFAAAMASGTWAISLSTTAANWNTLSSVPANNLGADNLLVFTGSLAQPWTFGKTLVITLATPFVYNPADGNLLMDVTVSGYSATGGGIFFDFNSPNTIMGRRYWSDSVDSGVGLVTGFDSAAIPVPEPAPLALLVTGLLGLGGRLKRRRS